MSKKSSIRNRRSFKNGGKKNKSKKSRRKQVVVKNVYRYKNPTFTEALVEGVGFGIGWEVGERAVEKVFDNDEA